MSVHKDVLMLKAQIRNWQRTISRLEDKIVEANDEISGMTEKDHETVLYLRNCISRWNNQCVVMEEDIKNTYEEIEEFLKQNNKEMVFSV